MVPIVCLLVVHWDFGWFTGTSVFWHVCVAVNADCLLVCLLVYFLQGAKALSTLAGHFMDPELSRLARCLPSRCLGAKADSTTERYSRAFDKFRLWAASYNEISVLPSNYLSVATYLEFLLQSNSSYSALEAAVYGIRWAHNLYGFSNPCESNLVKGILESAKRSLSGPVVKKEPVTPEMISKICQKFASVYASLYDLRTAAICQLMLVFAI